MFVSRHNKEIWIVEQYNHSIQAGEVANAWGNKNFERPSQSTITAVKEHDIGWVNTDNEVLFDEKTGGPVNFININVKRHVELYTKGYKKILEKDPYAGMLIGKHWIGLYTSRFGYDPTFTYNIPEELKEFMQDLIVKTQKEFIDVKMKYWKTNEKRSKFEDKIWMEYEFLQVMDRMSQEVSINTPEDKIERTLGPVRQSLESDEVYITIKQPGNGTVIVDPFPFEDEFETTVKLRRIDDRPYESHAELKQEIDNTPHESFKWKYVGK